MADSSVGRLAQWVVLPSSTRPPTHPPYPTLGLYPEAISAWTAALSLSSTSSSSPTTSSLLLSNRAQAYLQLREPSHAEADAAKALRLDPTNTKACIRRATALLALERHEDAARVLSSLSSSSFSSSSLPPTLIKTIQGLKDQCNRMVAQAQGEGAVDAPAKEAIGYVVTHPPTQLTHPPTHLPTQQAGGRGPDASTLLPRRSTHPLPVWGVGACLPLPRE